MGGQAWAEPAERPHRLRDLVQEAAEGARVPPPAWVGVPLALGLGRGRRGCRRENWTQGPGP